jgi:hypothetical protein
LLTPLQAGERVQFRRLQADGSWSGWGNATSATNSTAFSFSTSLREGTNPIEVRFVDPAGNTSLNHSLVAHLDSQAPAVVSIELEGAGLDRTWQAGDPLTMRLTFTETLLVTGTPALTLQIGDTSLSAICSETSDRTLTFSTTLEAGSLAKIAEGIRLTPGSLNLSSATITDQAGNHAVSALPSHLFGSGASDLLIGSDGNDVITGAGGADVISGGGGADLFLLRSGADSRLGGDGQGFDHITDFQAGLDQLQRGDGAPISSFIDLGSIASADFSSINALLNTDSFAAAGFAASFRAGSNLFVAINDSTPGFSATTDSLVLLSTAAA